MENQKIKNLLVEIEKKNYIIANQNKTLLQYSKQVEQQTLLEERNRMIRDLHDTVGHTFTSSIMGLDASIILLDKSPDKVKEKLINLRKVMDEGLQEVRSNIHAMIDDEDRTPLSKQLERMSVEFSTHTSTLINFEMQGNEVEIPGYKKIVIIRCLQESLTNAKRHGQASQIDILLFFSAQKLNLTVRDNGVGSHDFNFGFGLRSMEERISSLQGNLIFDSKFGHGATIICSMPLDL